jgi:NAD(P)-dependent dehydrogenase (short-subunit alcohol dehydrogenase family)
MGRCDIFVNNAGVSRPEAIHGTPLAERMAPLSESGWQTTLQTNLSAGVTLVNALAPGMVARGWGRIVHISSIGGLGSSEGRTAYTATKAALIGVTHTGALELGPCARSPRAMSRMRPPAMPCRPHAPRVALSADGAAPCSLIVTLLRGSRRCRHGVTVNCICPGPFLTDMPKNALSSEVQAGVAGKVPLRRWAEPHEICGPVLMLVSEAGSYVNGAILRVDGGLLSRAY